MTDEHTTRSGTFEGLSGDGEGLAPEPVPQLVLACCPDLSRFGERVTLYGTPVIVGRSEGLHLFPGGPLPGDRLSRRHATVVPAELADAPTVRSSSATAPSLPALKGRCLIEDLGSTNGTFLNGDRVTCLTPLGPGDLIRVGSILMVYVEEPVPENWDEPVELTGVSGAAHRLRRQLCKYAQSDSPVLLQGESGTGKEVAAHALHALSGRKGDSPVAVNCPAIPESLWESELFGHEKGAFTGAGAAKKGLAEQAAGGTLFLDEIGEIPLGLQPKLLRFLETGEITRVGGRKALKVETRTVSATNRDLAAAAKEGSFRKDLFARIAYLVLTLPPLRERKCDVPVLFYHFLHRELEGKPLLSVSSMERLMLHPWPLNVRELKSIVDLLIATRIADMEMLTLSREVVERLATYTRIADAPAAAKTSAQTLDEDSLKALLQEHKGNVAVIADVAGKHRWQVYRLLKKYSLDPDEYR